MQAAMKKAEKRALKKRVWKDNGSWQLLLLCIPALLGYILFNYIPILVSILIPFKDYKFSVGILDSAWGRTEEFQMDVDGNIHAARDSEHCPIRHLVLGDRASCKCSVCVAAV